MVFDRNIQPLHIASGSYTVTTTKVDIESSCKLENRGFNLITELPNQIDLVNLMVEPDRFPKPVHPDKPMIVPLELDLTITNDLGSHRKNLENYPKNGLAILTLPQGVLPSVKEQISQPDEKGRQIFYRWNQNRVVFEDVEKPIQVEVGKDGSLYEKGNEKAGRVFVRTQAKTPAFLLGVPIPDETSPPLYSYWASGNRVSMTPDQAIEFYDLLLKRKL